MPEPNYVTSGEKLEKSVSFRHAEAFPLIAAMILNLAKEHPSRWVTHRALVDRFLSDREGAALLERVRAKSSFADDRSTASNMIAWFSERVSVGRSEWAELFERKRLDGTWAYRPAPAVASPPFSGFDVSALEGDVRMFLHLRRERNGSLVRAKRAAARNEAGQLECEVCGFVARDIYPGFVSRDICEVHHRKPLGELTEATETSLDDLAVLCPNCHRAIHQTNPMMAVDVFREWFRKGRVCKGPQVG